jgi:hypothetical protein
MFSRQTLSNSDAKIKNHFISMTCMNGPPKKFPILVRAAPPGAPKRRFDARPRCLKMTLESA